MAATRRQAPRTRTQKSARPARRAKPALRAAEAAARGGPPRREIAALVCVAVAVFLVFVLYLGWSGGPVGRGFVTALRTLFGLLVYAVPPALLYAAWLIAAPQGRRPSLAVTWGIVLLSLAFMTAAAGGTFGLVGGARPATGFDGVFMRAHGGVVGESLWLALSRTIGSVGANVVIVTMVVFGILLITGSTLGAWGRHSARGARAAGRMARQSATTISSRHDAAAEYRRQAEEQEATLLMAAAGGGAAGSRPVASYGGAVTMQEPRPAPGPPRLVDFERDLADLFPAREGADPASTQAVADLMNEAVELEAIEAFDEIEQLTLADEAEAADDHETALAFEPAPAETRQWRLPDPAMLYRMGPAEGESQASIDATARKLIETLGHFNIEAWVIGTVSGPRVTRYEIQLAPGTKVSKVSSLKDDIAYSLAATDIRIQAPIPGKSAIGVEVPNSRPSFVALGDIYGDFPHNSTPLAFWLGQDITGKSVLADLTRLVHLLIAGTTGSGKSLCINGIITSILLRATPDEVRLILIDPKRVELSHFEGVPHLLAPVVTDHKQAAAALTNTMHEMDRRYRFMEETGNAQKLRDLNRKLVRMGERPLPYIVVVVDELADLMMIAPAEVEHAIIRLGQMGRAVGIHLVLATQRPSVDVVTGLIKTNVPSRIAFSVASQTDSRVILDTGGAESLLGEGDMLFHPYTSAKMLRVQGAMVTSEEMKMVTEFWRLQATPEYREDLLEPAGTGGGGTVADNDADEYLPQAIEIVVHTGAASVALLQRRLRVGYSRSGRLIDTMETMGIISGFEGSKARKVLIEPADLPRVLGGLGGGAAAAPPVSHDDTVAFPRHDHLAPAPMMDADEVREPFDEIP